MILHPAALIRPVKGVGSPKDSITAAGLASSATSRAAGLRSSAQVIKPMPTRALPASLSSVRIVVMSAWPEPIIPRPPELVTAEASFPPAADPIGASMIGCSIASRRVSAVSITGTRDPFGLWASRQWVPSRPGALGSRRARGRVGGELTAQSTQLLKPGSAVTHDRGDADHLAGSAGERHDGELDRDASTLLAHSRHRQDVAISVARLTGAHRGAITLPMPLPQTFRNDDVERTAEGFCLRKAEDAGRASVPETNHALGVCIDVRIRHAGNQTLGELRWVKLHDSSPNTGYALSVKRRGGLPDTDRDHYNTGSILAPAGVGLDSSADAPARSEGITFW